MQIKVVSMRFRMNNALYALVCSLLVGVPVAASAEFDLVRNDIGRVLGMDYVKDGNSTRGELGIHRRTNFLLFVPCLGINPRFGEQYFRRRVNNCSNLDALWPRQFSEVCQGGFCQDRLR